MNDGWLMIFWVIHLGILINSDDSVMIVILVDDFLGDDTVPIVVINSD